MATVQNHYNLADRGWEEVVDHCAAEGIGFLPWFPLATGDLAGDDERAVREVAERHDATPAQVALAWLLGRSPTVLPIPGTSSVEHLEENLGAAGLELDDDDLARLNGVRSD